MTRLTKSEIERSLLSGNKIEWKDHNGKIQHVELTEPTNRRLFSYLLSSDVRKPTMLPEAFITGLNAAFEARDDPASANSDALNDGGNSDSWRLKSIESEGFGGLNGWNSSTFRFEFDGQSYILEGPNGSGKSSLVGAIVWALTGERPRDQSDSRPHEEQPVYAKTGTRLGNWPPIATYPSSRADLQSAPRVKVLLTFESTQGSTAQVDRILDEGKVTSRVDPKLSVPGILIETGLLMPARFAQLRFADGRGKLTDAVQTLTGLDDLASIGQLVEGLCHRGREYRKYKTTDLADHRAKFSSAIDDARNCLSPLQVTVPSFDPADTIDSQGQMAAFGKMLTEKATQHLRTISDDLGEGLDLSKPNTQKQIVAAIVEAEKDLEKGLLCLESWRSLQVITSACDEDEKRKIENAISSARTKVEEAKRMRAVSLNDSKFRLKTLAAKWHMNHNTGNIEDCPLCGQQLAKDSSLMNQLDTLRTASDIAGRTFDDNLTLILSELDKAVPPAIRDIGERLLERHPRESLISDLRKHFVAKDTYSKHLVGVGEIIEYALSNAPSDAIAVTEMTLESDRSSNEKTISDKMALLEQILTFSNWFNENSEAWTIWWETVVSSIDSDDGDVDDLFLEEKSRSNEGLSDHITKISNALAMAEPFRLAAEAMRDAWAYGRSAADVEQEVVRREIIAENLQPLKALKPLCESFAREAIEDLSQRITTILDQIHLVEHLRFQSAKLQRKEGLIVRGELSSDFGIDATLVASTSWIRAVLWSFLFSLREEAIERLGIDVFPLLVFDDPQSTFDAQHRHLWAAYVASLQNNQERIQILLTTHDENFRDLIRIDGVSGRQALFSAPSSNITDVEIFEGEALERMWSRTLNVGTPTAGRSYVRGVREYVEGMLKAMLRGQDADITNLVIGELRERIKQYHDAEIPPWNRPAFKSLVKVLDPGRSSIKFLEGSHHTTGRNYGMGEGKTVEKYWTKTLKIAFERAYRTASSPWQKSVEYRPDQL